MIVNCDYCGEEVEKKKSNAEGKNFCDSSCYGHWMSDNRTGEKHPNHSKKKVNCENCGEKLERAKWRIKSNTNHFCDQDCKKSWMENNAPSGEEHHQYNSVVVSCSNCGSEKEVAKGRYQKQENFYCDIKCQNEKEGVPERDNVGLRFEKQCKQCGSSFDVHPYRKEEAEFCSKDCVGLWLSENRSGENHHQFKNYEENYGKDWPKERRKAREYYNNQCQVCLDSFDQKEEKIPIHHLIPVGNFEEKNNAHFQENLVQVCRSCHFKLEYSTLEEQIEILQGTKYTEKHGDDILEDFQ